MGTIRITKQGLPKAQRLKRNKKVPKNGVVSSPVLISSKAADKEVKRLKGLKKRTPFEKDMDGLLSSKAATKELGDLVDKRDSKRKPVKEPKNKTRRKSPTKRTKGKR